MGMARTGAFQERNLQIENPWPGNAGTVKVLHTLRPFVVIMAGASEADPWKD